jgi:tetratricopeptide (TPR) repeat protein
MGLLLFILSLIVRPLGIAIMTAMAVYLVLSYTLEHAIPHYHRKGIRLFKAEKDLQAIEEYKKSFDFFRRHTWIDRYRYITLLSSSRYSYTEMALVNIACCYLRLNNIELSKQYYHKALELFPDNEMAKRALNTIKEYEEKFGNSGI